MGPVQERMPAPELVSVGFHPLGCSSAVLDSDPAVVIVLCSVQRLSSTLMRWTRKEIVKGGVLGLDFGGRVTCKRWMSVLGVWSGQFLTCRL